MHITVSSRKLRENWGSYLDHIAATDDRLVITRHGRARVALVRLEDLKALEEAETGESPPQDSPGMWDRTW